MRGHQWCFPIPSFLVIIHVSWLSLFQRYYSSIISIMIIRKIVRDLSLLNYDNQVFELCSRMSAVIITD